MTGKRKKSETIIYTPAKTQKTSSLDNSPNSQSSGQSSDIAVTTADNQNLLVTIREAKTTATSKKILLLSISNSRPDTALGKEQEDHVTAYKSFLEMLITATEGQDIKKLPYAIAKVAKALIPDKVQEFDKILTDLDDKISKVISRNKRHEIIDKLKLSVEDEGRDF